MRVSKRALPLSVGIVIMGVLLLRGVDLVPFHPDETSLLFQSRDLERLLRDPRSLAYEPHDDYTQEERYRALNAPLPKYILGLGRRLVGFGPEAVQVDWDWSAGWEENLASGARPPEDLLRGARAASTLMALLAGIFLFMLAARLGGQGLGWIAFALYGFNALMLLHGRRAMAEGTTLMAVSLSMLSLALARERPGLAGLATALAASAKHSTLPLAAIGLVAAAGPTDRKGQWTWDWFRPLVVFCAIFLLTTLALNPFLWSHPLAGAEEIFESRRAFLADQVSLTLALTPERLLATPTQRLASLFGHLFLGPLQYQEVGNYAAALRPTIDFYRRQPAHTATRGPVGGSLLLALTMIGLYGMARGWRPLRSTAKKSAWILAAATGLQAAALLVFNPLPFQRYYLPLLPFIVLWQALGMAALGTAIMPESGIERDA